MYQSDEEDSRLLSPSGRIELLRTLSLFKRFGPPPPANILDLGGGTGPYSFRLAREGYSVDLIDAMPNHIEKAASKMEAHNLNRIAVGDARELDYESNSFDAVLMLGPMYHLIEDADRNRALVEAWRVLRPQGVLFCAAISRYASLFDGFFRGLVEDPEFERIVEQDFADGQHRNPTNHPEYFTSAKFHTADELESELKTAGFGEIRSFGLEGLSWLLPNLNVTEGVALDRLLRFIESTEAEEEIKGVSAHILGVGIK